MMQEAVDYNALSWVRQEIDVSLRQAAAILAEYSGSHDREDLLHDYAELLHQVRGPLQIAELEGADLLVAEMESVVAVMTQSGTERHAGTLEVLQKSMQALPAYLSRLQSSADDGPDRVLPLLNLLRAAGGSPSSAAGEPVLTTKAKLPANVFLGMETGSTEDIAKRAHAARVRFQSALLEWYRGGNGGKSTADLADVLAKLQEYAGTESEACLWWVGAGVADAVSAGLLPESREIKQLFGQLDRQIKRLVENDTVDFSDVQTQTLLGSLLNCISGIQADEGRLSSIQATFDPGRMEPEQHTGTLEEGLVEPAADLLMMDAMETGAAAEHQDACEYDSRSDQECGLAWQNDSHAEVPEPDADRNYDEILRGFSLCKDAVEEYLDNPAADCPLQSVPEVLDEVCRNLGNAGLDREAAVIASVKAFIECRMVESLQMPDDGTLMHLADAICGVEFYLECLRDGRIFGNRIIESAEASVAAIGYAVSVQTMQHTDQSLLEEPHCREVDTQSGSGEDLPVSIELSALQVIAPDADEEILEIFHEESRSELNTLGKLISGLDAGAVSGEQLGEIRRIFHTLKGNGRMLGANAVGEFAYALENLVNTAMTGGISVDVAFTGLLEQSRAAMSQLVEQIYDVANEPDMDIGMLASEAIRLSRGHAADTPEIAEVPDAAEVTASAEAEGVSGDAGSEFPVLAAGADPEILEIYIEEADEEVAILAEIIPAWIADPGEAAGLADIRRSMHTLKGSGRMAGAMFMGEFAWAMEDLLNHVIEGSINPDDELYSIVGKVPTVLKQLIGQLRDGSEPTGEAKILMSAAVSLRHSVNDVSVDAVPGTSEMPGSEVMVEDGVVAPEPWQNADLYDDTADTECSLLQIYTSECQDILATIRHYLDNDAADGVVTEPLYRCLHTLAGISESAEVGWVVKLASELDSYVSNIYHAQCRMPSAAIAVLNDCVSAIALHLERTPETCSDTDAVDALCERIAALQAASDPAAVSSSEEAEACLTDQQVVPQEAVAADVEIAEIDDVNEADDFAGVDQELFDIFLEEAAEIQDASEKVLNAWAAEPENHDGLAEYQRHLHTLKGSARMMNIAAIGDLSHSIEALLTRVAENTVETSPGLFSALFAVQDKLAEMLEQVRQYRMPGSCPELEATLNELLHTPSAETDSETESGSGVVTECSGDTESAEDTIIISAADGTVPDECAVAGSSGISEATGDSNGENDSMPSGHGQQGLTEQSHYLSAKTDAGEEPLEREICSIPPGPAESTETARKPKPARKRGELVKVQSDLLDDLVNYSGEINIYRSRMETQIGDYRFNLGELDQTINRLRDQLRKLEMETEAQVLYRHAQEADRHNQDFDPLELDRYSILQESSRSLMESISDLYSLLSLMENTTRDSETLLLQQSRVSTDLHEGLMRTRMTPFAGLETRLKRIVRQSAKTLNKKVELDLQGADGEMDRAVIERIIAPLEHMLRNSVAHGIELPDERIARGKDDTGRIAIAFDREGPDIVLRIADDGAGMNVDAIRARAVERGMLEPDAEISDSDLTQFVLQTGFTTASEVTQISGRGVGLDVVNSEVRQLGGSLHIASARGAGTTFTIRLPYTLAINQVLLVHAGTDTYCVPLGNVEGIVRVHPEELLACYSGQEQVYTYAGNQYQLKHLATLLNTDHLDANQMSARVPLLLMRVVDKRIALHVESLLGSREIVIKPVGAQLSGIDGISGATILGDGSVAMILDIFALSRSSARAQMPVIRAVSPDEKRLVVMVVDDSITVRKVTTRLLERNGYKVITAKDGVDATGQLQGCTPDFMLLDIEMPRMDGFELATHMRNDERLRHVPVIMITSRTGDKHRERARQIGVKYYLGKPYQENDLLETIDRIIRVTPDSPDVNLAEA